MKRPNTHIRLLGLLSLLLVGIPLLLAGCGSFFGAQTSDQAEAFDRIVPGLTRAEDVAGMGLDLQGSQMLSGADIARRLPAVGMRAQACIRAGIFCTGYVLPAKLGGGLLAKPQAAEMVLLVMNGRVVDKVLSADGPPPMRVATAF